MLPRYVMFQSTQNHRYLHLNKASSSVGPMHFHGDYSYGLETRFEVVPATKEKLDNEGNQLVHIRSMHNNKFWEKTRNSNTDWITATAEKTEENPGSAGCTLFEAEHLGQDSASKSDIYNIILRHKNSGYYIIASHDQTMYSGLKLDAKKPDVFSKFLDWQSIVMLPEIIRIKGDNGNYLRAYPKDGYLGFDPNFSNEPVFEFEVSASRDGGIRIKSVQYGKYWVDDERSEWVFRDGDFSTEHDTNTVFIATKIEHNKIALRCLKNNLFCKRLSRHNKDNCLATDMDYIDKYTPLIIEEPVNSRTIDNVEYRIEDARIYDEHEVALVSLEAINKRDVTDTANLNLTHTETYTRQWTTALSLTVGVKASLSCKIPLINGGGSISRSIEFNDSYEWGHDHKKEHTEGDKITVNLPPLSRVKVALTAKRASCEIPFSYTQRDTMENGHPKVYQKHDGLFKGHNAFNYFTDHGKITELTPEELASDYSNFVI
ncbi:hypothetical protein MKX03_033570 [Papaver bracteatum]|nr:hypothetical protein MKX03_033570 [Papaver bracteatum]